MIQKNIYYPTGSIKRLSNIEGETIEQKIERILSTNEPITDGAPIIYMERKDGVKPEYDVRTDRFDIALDAMDIIQRTKAAKREERQKLNSDEKPKTGTETIQGTNNGSEPAA